jgi:hypothetical protein
MINKYIRSIGVEIECGISNSYLQYLMNNFPIKVDSDGSVNVENPDYLNYSYNSYPKDEDVWLYNVEIKYYSSNYEELKKFILTVFNENYVWQNSSCGNHVHLKFTKNYYLLTFYTVNNIKRFVNKYKKYAQHQIDTDKYLDRLSNSYCKNIEHISNIIDNLESDRYYCFNIRCNKKHNRHNFIECRLFPYVTDAQEYLNNLNFIIDTITEILESTPTKYVFKI